jgi:8-oxo-dGTP diphosphatase
MMIETHADGDTPSGGLMDQNSLYIPDDDADHQATYPLAVHILLLRDDQVLMLRRQNTGYADGQFSLVAGHVTHGETVVQGAIREAKEEVGIDLSEDDLRFELVMHRRDDCERIDFFFSAVHWSGKVTNAEPDKCSELIWCSPDDLPVDTVPYVAQAFQNWRHGMVCSLYGWTGDLSG